MIFGSGRAWPSVVRISHDRLDISVITTYPYESGPLQVYGDANINPPSTTISIPVM